MFVNIINNQYIKLFLTKNRFYMHLISNELMLIKIYFFICNIYELELKYSCLRFSNNKKPDFSDEEIMTIYIYSMIFEEKYKIKSIHKFASTYMRSWFPKLPGYKNFNTRINRLSEPFKYLCDILFSNYCPDDCDFNTSLLDSMPIITCSGKRSAKVAKELVDKSFCSTKTLWYHGLKLHFLSFKRTNKLPFPESVVITPASENDLNVFKQNWNEFINRSFFGDKIYFDPEYFKSITKKYNSTMFIPIKAIKNQAEVLKQRDKAFNDLYSKAVSKIRQPIESLFNWLNEKTDIQRASRVRSTKGLLVHVFGKIAAAFIGFALVI